MDTILAAGATGERVVRFVALARAAGCPVSDYNAETPLGIADLQVILSSLGEAQETILWPPIQQPILGLLATQAVWDTLYARAGALTGLTRLAGDPSPTATSDTPDPTATATQTSEATNTNASPSAATGDTTEADAAPGDPTPEAPAAGESDTTQEPPAPGHWA